MNTKHIYRNIFLVLLLAFISCEKSDSDRQWGNSLIYIPQASLLDGGNTNHYPVPFDKNAPQQNYIMDTVAANSIKVILGVYRSGLEDLQAFSVSVQSNPAVLQQKLVEIEDAVALPADVYAFPDQVEVPAGHRESVFYLTIDRKKLLEEHAGLYGKKMLVALSLSKPSRYALKEELSSVVVVINSTTFLPEPELPNILKGGAFDTGDEAFWQTLKQNPLDHDLSISFDNGKLTVSTPGKMITNYVIYQTVEVEQGKKYRLSGDIVASNVTESWFEFYLHPEAPVYGGDYNPGNGAGRLIEFSSWTPGCLSTISGKIEDLYCNGPGVSPGAVFTAKYSGTVYFVIKVGAWDGTIGKIELDNLKVLKLD
ncbi:MAG: hypothetical protein QM594_21215 [Niabella sp.]